MLLNSPAKINLFLRVLHRREDGYHELASLFQTVNLFDTIELDFSEKDRFTCTEPDIPVDENNLVLKALTLFRKKTGLNFPVSIHLEKKIPHQAGLGGGSSNAATTLWAINSLFGKPVSQKDLTEWGGNLGSDVSFFFSTGTAYCTGRGEKVRAMPPLPEKNLYLVKPPFGISTKEVYEALKSGQGDDPLIYLKSFYEGKPRFVNDLEEAAFRIKPALKTFKEGLEQSGFQTVLMSGSGSSFFCLARISHKISRQVGQDVALDLLSNEREHCQTTKASEFECEDEATDSPNCPRVCEKFGLGKPNVTLPHIYNVKTINRLEDNWYK